MTTQFKTRYILSSPLVVLTAISLGCATASTTGAGLDPTAIQLSKIPVNDTSIFAPFHEVSLPSDTRAANGAPGPKYWQNRADYALTARIDTLPGVLWGTMVLRYTNNSPNTLDVIWFQTEQNLFRKGNAVPISGPPATEESDFGYHIDHFTQQVDGHPVAVQLEDHKTVSKVTLPQALRPGQTATFDVAWSFRVPSSVPRMGREGNLYQIAQWYPRVNVYDDIKGWNTEPYLGEGEFFLEYGDYSLDLTVPSNFIVGATGTLQNPADVLTPTQISRLARAASGDSVVRIVTVKELQDGSAHLKPSGMVTWKFLAQNVRDMVFVGSPDYQWDATHWKNIITQSYYRPHAASSWQDAADMARMSIQEYSERWFPYPYPQVSVAEGPVGGGMEYPMMSFDGVFATETQYLVVTHEIGHNWFPMIVGSNERMRGWMDEGINTVITAFSQARRYPEHGTIAERATGQRQGLEGRAGTANDFPLTISADNSPDNQYLAYDKPAGVLQVLRDGVLGPDTFDRGLRTYVQRWQFKHPVPDDFFHTMDDVAGRPLDWFWREWFSEKPSFDQAIVSVQQTARGDGVDVQVVYANRARGVLPLIVRFTFSDSTTETVRHPAEIWRTNSTRYTGSYTFPKKTVTRVQIDPDAQVIDLDRVNNNWLKP